LEIEGREPSQREEEHSHGTCRYLGEDNMGHMGLTLWALTVKIQLLLSLVNNFPMILQVSNHTLPFVNMIFLKSLKMNTMDG
jgi:hypothetical protein